MNESLVRSQKTESCDTCKNNVLLVHKICNTCFPLIRELPLQEPPKNFDNVSIINTSLFSCTREGLFGFGNTMYIQFTRRHIFLYGDLPTLNPVTIAFITENFNDFSNLVADINYFREKVCHKDSISSHEIKLIFGYLRDFALILYQNKIELNLTFGE